MNIEFEKMRKRCLDLSHMFPHDIYKCDATAGLDCTEANCPLKSEDVAVRMSNGVIQELFAEMKTAEKVCRWKHERVEVNAESYYYETHYTRSCGNGIVRQTSPTLYCWDCGGKVVVE